MIHLSSFSRTQLPKTPTTSTSFIPSHPPTRTSHIQAPLPPLSSPPHSPTKQPTTFTTLQPHPTKKTRHTTSPLGKKTHPPLPPRSTSAYYPKKLNLKPQQHLTARLPLGPKLSYRSLIDMVGLEVRRRDEMRRGEYHAGTYIFKSAGLWVL